MAASANLITLLAAMSTAVMAGFYATFSGLVMPGLGRVEPSVAMASMQSINRFAAAPWLVVGVLIAGGSSIAAAITGGLDPSGGWSVIVAATAYWASVALTVFYHVPRNNVLDKAAPGDPYWSVYLTQWTRANHARALACLVAAALFAWAAA